MGISNSPLSICSCMGEWLVLVLVVKPDAKVECIGGPSYVTVYGEENKYHRIWNTCFSRFVEVSGDCRISMAFFLILCLVLIPLVYVYYVQNERFKLCASIPGPTPLPILGNTLTFAFLKSEGGLWSRHQNNSKYFVVKSPFLLRSLPSNRRYEEEIRKLISHVHWVWVVGGCLRT